VQIRSNATPTVHDGVSASQIAREQHATVEAALTIARMLRSLVTLSTMFLRTRSVFVITLIANRSPAECEIKVQDE
jgi:hypothetical protein